MNTRVLFGPPGTGKTTEFLRLLETELKTVAPERIAYVSFTKEGAYQGTRRAQEQFNITEEQCQYFRTLHSIAFRAMGTRVTEVIGKKHYKEFGDVVGMNFTGYYTEEFRNNDDKYLFFDEIYRNNPVTASLYLDTMSVPTLEFVRKSYRSYKKNKGLIDYTDMIQNFVKEGAPLDIDVAFLDEAQDLTTLQWAMWEVMTQNCQRVYIAGDDDQAIYQWSGADVAHFLAVKGDITILSQTHRYGNGIRDFAASVSGQIKQRVTKEYNGADKVASVQYLKDFDEVDIKPNESYMFLSRNNWFLTDIAAWLRSRGMVYRLKCENSVKRPNVEAINQYEELRKHPTEVSPYTRLGAALKPRYNIDDPWYMSLKWEQDEIDYYRNVIGNKTDLKNVNVDVSTIHSVKGAEADNVIVLSDMTKATYQNLKRNPDSEHRAFYVGVTRAKNRLYVVKPKTGTFYPFYGEESK